VAFTVNVVRDTGRHSVTNTSIIPKPEIPEPENCPCGDGCEKLRAECCGEQRWHCETLTHTTGAEDWRDHFQVCVLGKGCASGMECECNLCI
jgi:hypothetical protein